MKKGVISFLFIFVLVAYLGSANASKSINLTIDNNVSKGFDSELKINNPETLAYYKIVTKDNKYGIVKSSYASSNINYSNLKEEDIIKLNDFNKFSIVDNYGNMYKIQNNMLINENNSNIKVTHFSLFNDELKVILKYDSKDEEWVVYYPTVEVKNGISNNYYLDLNEALNNTVDGGVINLLGNQSVLKTLNISKSITINGNGYKIISNADYLFTIDKKISNKDVITLNNINIDVKSFIKMNKNNFKKMKINNCFVTYKVLGIENKYKNYFELSSNTIFSLPLN